MYGLTEGRERDWICYDKHMLWSHRGTRFYGGMVEDMTQFERQSRIAAAYEAALLRHRQETQHDPWPRAICFVNMSEELQHLASEPAYETWNTALQGPAWFQVPVYEWTTAQHWSEPVPDPPLSDIPEVPGVYVKMGDGSLLQLDV